MELVKAKFKQTEVGLIPEDWKVIAIGDSLIFKNGLNKESEFFGYGTPIINYMDVFKNYGISKKDIKGKVFLNSQEIQSFSAKKGDVFFTRTSETQEEIGASAVLMDEVENCVFSGFVLRGRPKNNVVSSEYYQYCLIPNYIRSQIISTSSYTTRALTNGRFLSTVKLIVPPALTEQKAIATALSDVDDLIANLDKLISKKKAIKQGAMQQLLTPPHKGGKRLAGFTGEWVEKKLGNVADFFKGKGLPKSDILQQGKYKCIHYGELFTKYNQIIKYVKSRTNQNNEVFLSKKNDVLMPTSDVTPNGLATASALFEDDIILGGDVLVIRPNKNLYGAFLSYQVSINRPQIMSLISGTTVYHLYGSDMAKFNFYFPDFDEQKAIVKILSDMGVEIEQLKAKKAKYQDIKQGMMQELLTGKTRLV